MNFNDVAIVSVKGSDYRIHFWYMSKGDDKMMLYMYIFIYIYIYIYIN